MHSQVKQQGFTLYIVLVLMAIIAILILAGGQALNTEMRISSNDADKKYAFGLAEDALKSGELHVLQDVHPNQVLSKLTIQETLDATIPDPEIFFAAVIGDVFTEDCDGEAGLCTPAMEQSGGGASYTDTPAWEKDGAFAADNSIAYELSDDANVSQEPRYIIEFLGPSADASNTLYRVTARAWGRNATTEVTLQSVISVNNQIATD